MIKRLIPYLLTAVSLTSPILAQTAVDLNEGTRLMRNSIDNNWSFSWWGRLGRTYFIQQSHDLMSWQYIPVIELGQDRIAKWSFATDTDKLFMRLKYTDAATLDPWNDDFDEDGISNIHELTAPAELALDPFDPDSNKDEVLDGLEDTDGDFMLNGDLA